MKIAVIPARGGSKRIPRKNIKPFNGKPIIAYSIEAAMTSGCFDRVIVSTDDQEIADTAIQYGAEVPFFRPAALADDFTGTNAVAKHTIEALEARGEIIDYACCIYATAPFVSVESISKGLELLSNSPKSKFAVTVTTFPFPIQRALRSADDHLTMMIPENILVRSQDLEEAYHDAGQIYWGTRNAFIQEEPLFLGSTLAIPLPRHCVQDIDTPEDWIRAELMHQAWAQTQI